MKRIFLILTTLLYISCGKPDNSEANHAIDTVGIRPLSWVAEISPLEEFEVSLSLNPSDVRFMDKTCAVIIHQNELQEAEWLIRDEAESKKRMEREEEARIKWKSQPHDSSEYFVYEDEKDTGDREYYISEAHKRLDELKIPKIIVESQGYVRLKGINKKEWTLDIRTKMEPNWNIILFDPNREPVVTTVESITRKKLVEYFRLE